MAARKQNSIDPIYTKYVAKVMKTMASTDFYNYFMDTVGTGENAFQFSNRRLIKKVDEKWVVAIEKCMDAFQNVVKKPRNFIREDAEVVNVSIAKQAGADVVRHLTTHGNLIDSLDDEKGVRPNRLMNKFKEDSWDTYENKFVYTLLEHTYEFVSRRYEALLLNKEDETGAFLKMGSDASSYSERIRVHMDIRINQKETFLDDNDNIFNRIARLYKNLELLMQTPFATQVSKYGRVKNPIVKTNAIRKHPDFKACYKLWQFLYAYTAVGYEIKIVEQASKIDEAFEQDIYYSMMVNYTILKNYLETEEEREIDLNRKIRKRKLKPQYIREFIEEFVKNYDLPEVETRKILIEEISRAQLLREEEQERQKLLAERERRLREMKKAKEAAKIRAAKEKEREKERKAKEKEKEKERKLKEEELEKERKAKEEFKKTEQDIRRINQFREEIARFQNDKENILEQIELEKAAAAEKAAALAEKSAEAAEKAELAEKKAKAKAEAASKPRVRKAAKKADAAASAEQTEEKKTVRRKPAEKKQSDGESNTTKKATAKKTTARKANSQKSTVSENLTETILDVEPTKDSTGRKKTGSAEERKTSRKTDNRVEIDITGNAGKAKSGSGLENVRFGDVKPATKKITETGAGLDKELAEYERIANEAAARRQEIREKDELQRQNAEQEAEEVKAMFDAIIAEADRQAAGISDDGLDDIFGTEMFADEEETEVQFHVPPAEKKESSWGFLDFLKRKKK